MSKQEDWVEAGLPKLIKLGEGEGRFTEYLGVFLGLVSGGKYENPLMEFAGQDGVRVRIPSNTDLKVKLAGMEGRLAQIRYTGTRAIPGGKTYKDFAVLICPKARHAEFAERFPALSGPPPAVSEAPVGDDDLPF